VYLQKNKLPPLRSKIYLKKHLQKPYNIRVSEAECEISLVAHYFKPGYGFTPQKWLFLAKFSPLQNLKVAIYKGFAILGRRK
jgi:hypothetical protein